MGLPTKNPLFNGWDPINANLVVSRMQITREHPSRSMKRAGGPGGVTPEAELGVVKIRLSGRIANGAVTADTDAYLLHQDWGTLLNAARGNNFRTKFIQLTPFGTNYTRHYLAQLVGNPTFALVPKTMNQADVVMDFVSDDPFIRNNSVTTVLETPCSGDPSVVISWGSSADFNSTAPRVPVVLNCGAGWQSGEKLRWYNQLTGERFEYVVSQNLSSSEDLVIDAENHEVYEGTSVVMQKVSGTFPHLEGGSDNTIDFTGTDRFQQFTFMLWDRYWG